MLRHGFLLAFLCLTASAHAEASAGEPLTFEKHVWPVFRAHCFDCHGAADELQGNLDLRLVRFMVRGGDSGAALAPGDTGGSYLLDRIKSGEMPPGDAKVTAAEIAVIEAWIAQGAKTTRPEPESLPPGIGILPEEREFWTFQPIRRPALPPHSPDDRCRTPIDALLLKDLREAGLSFAPEADRLTLLQRACFNLTGLPPTPDETQAFLADESPEAYDRLIERLLASPRYGERWGRHWLDVAGYADSEGATTDDPVRPYAWKYRDYVVRAFNADKPFDEFLIEQLAGDELVPPPHVNLAPEQIEKLIATGFLRMAADGTGRGGDQDLARNQVVGDTIKIVSTSLLGLSVGCAQCHDHRYDPIPQTDYYRLRAVFEPALNVKQWRAAPQRLISLYTDADRAKAAEVEAEAQQVAAEKAAKQAEYMAAALEMELQKHPEDLRNALRDAYNTPADKRTPEQQKLLKERPSVNITPGVLYQYNEKAAEELKTYDARIAEIRARKPVEDFVRALTEIPGQVPATHLFHRGDHRQPKGEIAPGDLIVAAPPGEQLDIPADDPNLPTTGRRLAYARWLTNGRHPLLARVVVNRIWMHHFGRGIVGTPSDFGKLGEKPTHPELLDWLADEFARDWSIKRLHRLIMTSTAYRQSSQRDSQREMLDPGNTLYSRMPVRRLDAEVVHDRILATSGALQPALFGPAVPVKADDAGQVIVDGPHVRRGVYIQVRRTQPLAMLTSFDAPVMEVNCERRESSTVATQALMLMNSEFILKQAQLMAERVRHEAAAEPRPELPAELIGLAALGREWQYGYGSFEPGQSVAFQPLPHWSGSAWQGGPSLPDPALGWVIVNSVGGHAGNDAQHSTIRRWTAPRDGIARIAAELKHSSESGDGVRARLVSSRLGLIGEWTAFHSDTATPVESLEIRQGDTLDFIIDCRENPNSDSFQWLAQIELKDAAGGIVGSWHSQQDFGGPPAASLPQQIARAWRLAYGRPATADELRIALEFLADQMQQLRAVPAGKIPPEQQAMTDICQALLSSNEFLYQD